MILIFAIAQNKTFQFNAVALQSESESDLLANNVSIRLQEDAHTHISTYKAYAMSVQTGRWER